MRRLQANVPLPSYDQCVVLNLSFNNNLDKMYFSLIYVTLI